ncbi:hypothetical protein [Rhodopirellula bahusiensis]
MQKQAPTRGLLHRDLASLTETLTGGTPRLGNILTVPVSLQLDALRLSD